MTLVLNTKDVFFVLRTAAAYPGVDDLRLLRRYACDAQVLSPGACGVHGS
jgi:hypothetical protein